MSNQGVSEIVIAATYRQYTAYVREKQKNPRQCIFVNDPFMLNGLKGVTVTVIGEPWTNPVFLDPRIIKKEGNYVLATDL